MKKIILALALTLLAQGAFLVQEAEEGNYRVCIYDDGTAISIPWAEFCPYSI